MIKKSAFTLAEILITLAVIGIVAALTIGIFLPKIHSTIRARQIATAEVKFTKAMEQMALNNAVGPYYNTTSEFVDELQNYLKIAKVCDNEHLADCFGYDKIKLNNEDEVEIKFAKDGASLGMTGNDTDFGETIGLITIDGTSMLLSWNKECPILTPGVYEWGGNTNVATSCVAAVIDINGDKSPNMQNKDVALFRANSLGESCGIKFGDNCWGTPFIANVALNHDDCVENRLKYGVTNCYEYDNSDFWGGAMKKCANEGKTLPSSSELAAFATYLYGKTINDDDSYVSGTLNATLLAKTSNILSSAYTASNSDENWRSFYIWSNTETDVYYAGYRSFYAGSTNHSATSITRNNSSIYGVCVNK